MNARLAAAIVLSLTAIGLPAHAATVISSNDQASEILGLQIGSGDYDVTFTNGVTGTFANAFPGGLPTLPDTAQNIIDDIAAALNAANVHFAGLAPNGIDEFGIPISASGGTFDFARGFQVNNGKSVNLPSDWIFANASLGPYSDTQTGITSFPVLTPVPLPAAAWLMLSGLGGLGALARKKRADHRIGFAVDTTLTNPAVAIE